MKLGKKNIIAQWVYDTQIFANRKQSIGYRLLFLLSYHFGRLIIAIFDDPLVTYKLGDVAIRLPLSHPLGVFRATCDFLENQARLSRLIKNKYKDLTIIIVGANVGDGIAVIRNVIGVPVLGIDGERKIFDILSHNCAQFDDVVLENVFISDNAGSISGRLVINKGSAAFSRDAYEGATTSTKPLQEVIDANPSFANSQFLIIDTDGYDYKVIVGALSWIKKQRPIIFFEYDPYLCHHEANSGFEIFPLLRGLDYKSILVYLNNGEYLCSAALDNHELLQDLHAHVAGRGGQLYLDICAFAGHDLDLFHRARAGEIGNAVAKRAFRPPADTVVAELTGSKKM